MKINLMNQGVDEFLQSCPTDFDYPLGGNVEIPLETELKLSELFLNGLRLEPDEVSDEFGELSRKDAYSLAIFSLRMAVYAVYNDDPRLLETNLWALCVDRDLLDWRDVLVSLSIAEDCCLRLSLDFKTALEPYICLATERRMKTIREGYFPRTPEMRGVETMGYKGVLKDGHLQYYKML